KADGTVYGGSVNIAARLQALAPPGGIVVSQAVLDVVGSRVPGRYGDLGDQQVKDIETPVRAFRLDGEGPVASGDPEQTVAWGVKTAATATTVATAGPPAAPAHAAGASAVSGAATGLAASAAEAPGTGKASLSDPDGRPG